jgi:hypothetical protein
VPIAVPGLGRRLRNAILLLVPLVGIGSAVDGSVALAGSNPTVASLAPADGPERGGTTVVIAGTNLTGVRAVDFGTTPAASFTAISSTSLSAVSPPGHGVVDVVVTTLAGTSPVTKKDRFSYGPEVTGVNPTSGPPGGGTAVTISGVNFTEATAVDFGSTPAASFTIVSDNVISATSPPGSGTVDVIVFSAQDVSATTSADQFDYGPVVTGLSPSFGPPAGGTTVTVLGANFGASPTVNFGTGVATGVAVNAAQTQIMATSPAGTGIVNVVVTTTGGTSAIDAADKFNYEPVVSSVTPDSGPATGGTTVTIGGSNFTGAFAVLFDAVPATFVTVTSDTSITAVSPPGTLPQVGVTVVSPGGSSAANSSALFNYGPVIAKVKPAFGVGSGGTKVGILGLDFRAVQAVFFGTTPASSFRVPHPTRIVAIAPAGTGVVDVTVQTAAGTSPLVGTDQFDYAPTVVRIGPVQGKPAGGTKVQITGTNFEGVTSVDFGSTSSPKFTVVSKTRIVAVSPPGTGIVDVTVVSLGGTSPTSSADNFTY